MTEIISNYSAVRVKFSTSRRLPEYLVSTSSSSTSTLSAIRMQSAAKPGNESTHSTTTNTRHPYIPVLLGLIVFSFGLLVLVFRILLTICPPLLRHEKFKRKRVPDKRLKTGDI